MSHKSESLSLYGSINGMKYLTYAEILEKFLKESLFYFSTSVLMQHFLYQKCWEMFIFSIKTDSGVWVASAYGKCTAPCSRSNFGVQKRNVNCMGYGGRPISESNCNGFKKPTNIKECASTECTTEWKTGPWSQVMIW